MRRLYLIVNAYTERVHYFLFGQTMGEGMALFVRQLSISFMGLIAANGIFFAAMLYIGRALGPETFGRFSLTIAIGQLLVIPMMLGMDVAAMRGVAVEQLLLWQKRYITAGFIVVMMGALTVAAIVFGFKQYWESALTLPRGALAMAAVLAMSLAFRNYFDAVARGLGRFKVQALVRMAEALIALGAAVVLAWLGSQNRWRGFVGAIITAATSASLLYIAGGELGSFISFAQWRTATAWHMWRYIRFGMLGALGAVMLVSADKILVGRIFGAPQLGIYAAYHLLSVQVALQLSYVFINVFFPAVSRQRNKQAVLRKLDRLAVYFTGPALALSVLTLAAGLRVLSNEYPFSWTLAAGMGLFAVIIFFYQVYWWFFTSLGAAGVRFTSLTNLLGGAVFLAGIYWLSPRLGLLAPAVSFLGVAACLAAAGVWWRRQYFLTMH